MDFLLFLCYHKREFCGRKIESQFQTYIINMDPRGVYVCIT